ncbi:MAG: peptidoglycan DD-metalloendopeptidase family protein [Patescibacteria group bacterium]|jgi:murein DD-endopeptidase MepM/ murein hydrolase activator NlpD
MKTKTKIIGLFTLTIAVLAVVLFNFSVVKAETLTISAVNNQQVQDLEAERELKKLEIEKIQKKLEVYEKSLADKRQEKITLQNELEILSEQIQQTELKSKKLNLQIDETNLEIQAVLLRIIDQETEIAKQKQQLGEMIRQIDFNDQKNYLEILTASGTFSDFFDEVVQLSTVQSSLQRSLTEVKALRDDLTAQRAELEKKSADLNTLKDELTTNLSKLDGQESAKTYYLTTAKKSEKKFQSLIDEAKKEQQQINSDIVALEKSIRQKLAGEGEVVNSTGRLIWPTPKNTITAFFHDPDYPFRNIFEHPAIDYRTPQGTPVKAADSGYVAQVKNGGARGYSYIMIIHSNGLATVYGHVSKIYVKADTPVKQGDIIGLSGGMPGTSGAGNLTSGPHMHFEVRLNGIPVNPLDYLP